MVGEKGKSRVSSWRQESQGVVSGQVEDRREGMGWDARGWEWGWVQNSAEGQRVMSQG